MSKLNLSTNIFDAFDYLSRFLAENGVEYRDRGVTGDDSYEVTLQEGEVIVLDRTTVLAFHLDHPELGILILAHLGMADAYYAANDVL